MCTIRQPVEDECAAGWKCRKSGGVKGNRKGRVTHRSRQPVPIGCCPRSGIGAGTADYDLELAAYRVSKTRTRKLALEIGLSPPGAATISLDRKGRRRSRSGAE